MDGKNTPWTCNHLRSEGHYDGEGVNDTRTFYCALTGKYCIGTSKKGRVFTGKNYDNDIAIKNCPAYNLPIDLATRVRGVCLERIKSEVVEEILEISGELT